MSKLRRGRLQECISICDEILSANPSDQAAWIIKCKAVIKQNYIDDIEMDEEGLAEMILDENAGEQLFPWISILIVYGRFSI